MHAVLPMHAPKAAATRSQPRNAQAAKSLHMQHIEHSSTASAPATERARLHKTAPAGTSRTHKRVQALDPTGTHRAPDVQDVVGALAQDLVHHAQHLRACTASRRP